MSSVPNEPAEFFGRWLPEAFEPLAARIGAKNSPGALVFQVGEDAPLAIRIEAGRLSVAEGVPSDTIAQVRLTAGAFEPIIVRGAELLSAEQKSSETHLLVLRALTLDAERVGIIRGVPGSVAFVLKSDAEEHRLLLTPGTQQPNVQAPECSVRCQLDDFLAMQRGETNPFELMMNGKIQISGDAQIPMALSSLFV
ncbi:MAG TPA: SCP2 sterol-binding domain-containing protein [Polyangiaceae bacterium]|nr:SCP2 sterol-binding domain-containing protein [Polyangiaceae bacterium]